MPRVRSKILHIPTPRVHAAAAVSQRRRSSCAHGIWSPMVDPWPLFTWLTLIEHGFSGNYMWLRGSTRNI